MSAIRLRAAAATVSMLLALVALVAAARSAAGARRDDVAFPHAKHANLFPTCQGCHAGVPAGRAEDAFPSRGLCAECHGVAESDSVEWRAPTRRPTNLAFSHPAHLREAGPDAAACATCHQTRGDTAWMHVAAARPGACLGCHEHRASAHLASDSDCASCHRPLTAATSLPLARIADFPTPPSHRSAEFLEQHGAMARGEGTKAGLQQCAVCHASESCERCHLDGASLEPVRALGRDARVASLVAGRGGRWPVPRSHGDPQWSETHGAAARGRIAGCATCHAQASCDACHTGSTGREVIARLPAPPAGAPQGAQLLPQDVETPGDIGRAPTGGRARAPVGTPVREPPAGGGAARDALRFAELPQVRALATHGTPAQPAVQPPARPVPRDSARPRADAAAPHDSLPKRETKGDDGGYAVRVHPPEFWRSHGADAAARVSCGGCHAQRFCESCHGGESKRRFHPANFVARHAPEAYGQEKDCTTCHNVEVFCRDCHQQAGARAASNRDVAYHDAQPNWLLQHGRAGRQALTTCVSCHSQRDCMQCHSQSSGLRVNPHGRDFKPERVAKRDRFTCRYCHLTDPLDGP